MRASLPTAALAYCIALVVALATPRAQDAVSEYRPPPPPEQPVAFSHKTHLAAGAACTTCHTGALTAAQATLPPAATCMTCHATVRPDSTEVQKVAAFHTRQEPIPWRRVYRLPTFVYFSHQVHAPSDNSMTCESCHGNVREMTAMQKVKDTSMATCVDCHTARSAPARCDSCHEPR